MAFHLCAYVENQDTGGVLTPVAALADPSMTVSGDNIQIPDYAPYLAGVYALGTTITRAQLQAPSLRRTINYEVYPVNVGIEPLSPPVKPIMLRNPIPLDPGEQMQAYLSEGVAGAEYGVVLVWLSDGEITPAEGEIYTVRVTNATTLTAYTWTNVALTFDQVLPVGRYAIVGASFSSAGMLAFRFLFQGQTARPGGLGSDAVSDIPADGQRFGGWGIWGEFHSTTPPTVDVLSISADTSTTGVIDLIKLE